MSWFCQISHSAQSLQNKQGSTLLRDFFGRFGDTIGKSRTFLERFKDHWHIYSPAWTPNCAKSLILWTFVCNYQLQLRKILLKININCVKKKKAEHGRLAHPNCANWDYFLSMRLFWFSELSKKIIPKPSQAKKAGSDQCSSLHFVILTKTWNFCTRVAFF